jgi:hypothetical protein
MVRATIQKTMLKGQKAGYYKKQNTKEYHKKRIVALDQLIKSGAKPDNIVVILPLVEPECSKRHESDEKGVVSSMVV